jgi:hypothetical protein
MRTFMYMEVRLLFLETSFFKGTFLKADKQLVSSVCSGKRADAPRAKPLKPSEKKPGLQERKALQDVSNFSKGTALKDRSVKERSQQRKALQNLTNTIQSKERPTLKEESSTVKERSALDKQVVNPLNILTDEEIKKCREWAKDGPEGAHFHDHQKSDKDLLDKRKNKSYDCSF